MFELFVGAMLLLFGVLLLAYGCVTGNRWRPAKPSNKRLSALLLRSTQCRLRNTVYHLPPLAGRHSVCFEQRT